MAKNRTLRAGSRQCELEQEERREISPSSLVVELDPSGHQKVVAQGLRGAEHDHIDEWDPALERGERVASLVNARVQRRTVVAPHDVTIRVTCDSETGGGVRLGSVRALDESLQRREVSGDSSSVVARLEADDECAVERGGDPAEGVETGLVASALDARDLRVTCPDAVGEVLLAQPRIHPIGDQQAGNLAKRCSLRLLLSVRRAAFRPPAGRLFGGAPDG